mmetsp:Transcript_32729/g.52686  ORF Transcript_32729/g.52686 Transcript_32729/m.52686 type:complete len:242 (+) Transcript_32729:331-1056(+)
MKVAVEKLCKQLGHVCPDEGETPLMDVYILRTSAAETDKDARDPQKWHLDDVTKFLVAAVVLSGQGATEFHAGPYADLSEGVSPEVLNEWTVEWRKGWVDHSQSDEEKAHWTAKARAAELISPGNDCQCDWNRADVKPQCGPGDGVFFWSNKVHRGPATKVGEERIILFVSWNAWTTRSKATTSPNSASLTDYSYYEDHLTKKLELSEKSKRIAQRELAKLVQRPAKRKQVEQIGGAGAGT